MIKSFRWTCEIEGVFTGPDDTDAILQAERNRTPIDLGVGRDVLIDTLSVDMGRGAGVTFSILASEAPR